MKSFDVHFFVSGKTHRNLLYLYANIKNFTMRFRELMFTHLNLLPDNTAYKYWLNWTLEYSNDWLILLSNKLNR